MSDHPRLVDVAVIGGGPAGIAAGARAAERGARVVVIDRGLRPGGQVWRHRDRRHVPARARRWMARVEASGAEWIADAVVSDLWRDASLAPEARWMLAVAHGDGRATTLSASAVVLATGARERFLPFPGWTLPNVVGVGGAQALLKGGLDVRGRRVVVAGSGPLILPVAAALARGGARLIAVAEQAPATRVAPFAFGLLASPGKLWQGARYRSAFASTRFRLGTWVARADGAARVERATLTDGERSWSVACDLLCVAHGLVPSLELARLAGCAIAEGHVATDALQRTSVDGIFCAGEGTGVKGEDGAIAEGEIAGLAAAGDHSLARDAALARRRDAAARFADRIARTFAVRPELLRLADAQTIVCRCEDVRCGALDRAWSGRQAKLYTRAGMGPCHGAVCGCALEMIFGYEPGVVRPPVGAPSIEAWTGAVEGSATV